MLRHIIYICVCVRVSRSSVMRFSFNVALSILNDHVVAGPATGRGKKILVAFAISPCSDIPHTDLGSRRLWAKETNRLSFIVGGGGGDTRGRPRHTSQSLSVSWPRVRPARAATANCGNSCRIFYSKTCLVCPQGGSGSGSHVGFDDQVDPDPPPFPEDDTEDNPPDAENEPCQPDIDTQTGLRANDNTSNFPSQIPAV